MVELSTKGGSRMFWVSCHCFDTVHSVLLGTVQFEYCFKTSFASFATFRHIIASFALFVDSSRKGKFRPSSTVDLGTTNHMTGIPNLFSTFQS